MRHFRLPWNDFRAKSANMLLEQEQGKWSSTWRQVFGEQYIVLGVSWLLRTEW